MEDDLLFDSGSGYLTLPDGVSIERIHLRSYLYGYFGRIPLPPPPFDRPLSDIYYRQMDCQTFALSRDGNLKVECKQDCMSRRPALESMRTTIMPDLASLIIDRMVLTITKAPTLYLICDGPSWEMTLTSSDGRRYTCHGCMWADPEYEGVGISEFIREKLSTIVMEREYSIIDPNRLALFDGLKEDDDDEDDDSE